MTLVLLMAMTWLKRKSSISFGWTAITILDAPNTILTTGSVMTLAAEALLKKLSLDGQPLSHNITIPQILDQLLIQEELCQVVPQFQILAESHMRIGGDNQIMIDLHGILLIPL